MYNWIAPEVYLLRLITVLMLISLGACATKPIPRDASACEEAEVDDLDPSVRGNAYTARGSYNRFGLFQAGSRVLLRTRWEIAAITNATVAAGTPVMLVFEDGRREKAITVRDAAPFVEGFGTTWEVEAALSSASVELLSRVGLFSLHIDIGGRVQAVSVQKPARKKMQTLAICFAGGY